jgi:CBS domain containing-hemolysin-like protein
MFVAWSLVAAAVLIALNAFFVAAEYAVVAARNTHIHHMRERGWIRVAAAMERLKANPAGTIGAIQVCITMTNLMLGWIGEPAMSAVLDKIIWPLLAVSAPLFHALSLTLCFLIVTLLTVVLSELLPNALSLQYIESAARLTAVPVWNVQRMVRPLVWLMNKMANAITIPLGLGRMDEVEQHHVTMEELRLQISQATEDGIITPRERSLLLNSLTIGTRRVREIMVPRVRVQYLSITHSMKDNRAVIERYLHTRLPLCDGSLDKVIGVVSAKDFLIAEVADADISILPLLATRPVFVPETISLDRLLGTLHEHRTQFVFIVDEYGGVEGICTLQDVVDELVGEIDEAE